MEGKDAKDARDAKDAKDAKAIQFAVGKVMLSRWKVRKKRKLLQVVVRRGRVVSVDPWKCESKVQMGLRGESK